MCREQGLPVLLLRWQNRYSYRCYARQAWYKKWTNAADLD